MLSVSILAAQSCQKPSTAAAAVSLIVLLAIVGGVIALAVANARSRRLLDAATAELEVLRPENARLREWVHGLTGPGSPEFRGVAGPPTSPPQWYRDPGGRHELRWWDGSRWTEDVADAGATSKDPPD